MSAEAPRVMAKPATRQRAERSEVGFIFVSRGTSRNQHRTPSIVEDKVSGESGQRRFQRPGAERIHSFLGRSFPNREGLIPIVAPEITDPQDMVGERIRLKSRLNPSLGWT